MSIKLKMSWTDNNVIIEGVRIYKSTEEFNENARPVVYAEILDGAEFYEDFNVTEGQNYFYMLSCFLGEQEVFTECYEISASVKKPIEIIVNNSIISAVAENHSGTVSNIRVPAYKKGDVILITSEKWGNQSSAISLPPGFTGITTTASEYRYVSIGYKIAEFDSNAETSIAFAVLSASVTILRASKEITSVDFNFENIQNATFFSSISATGLSRVFYVATWSIATTGQSQQATVSTGVAVATPQSFGGVSSFKHVMYSKMLDQGEPSGTPYVSITGSPPSSLLTLVLTFM